MVLLKYFANGLRTEPRDWDLTCDGLLLGPVFGNDQNIARL